MFKLLLPLIIPSWRFFDSVGPSVEIEIQNSGGEWELLQTEPSTRSYLPIRLFFNSEYNEHLYLYTLAERITLSGDSRCVEILKRRIAPLTRNFRIRVEGEVAFES